MSSCEEVLNAFLREAIDALKATNKDRRERAFNICRAGGRVVAGPSSTGTEAATSVLPCSSGESLGVFHTHNPFGSPFPSPKDYLTALGRRRPNVQCLGHQETITCWKVLGENVSSETLASFKDSVMNVARAVQEPPLEMMIKLLSLISEADRKNIFALCAEKSLPGTLPE